MTDGTSLIVPHDPWLSQGDVFSSVLITRVGVLDGVAAQAPDRGPALLVSHGCAIDKKTASGASRLEYLSFLPIQDVTQLEPDRAGNLRRSALKPQPFEVLYLGDVPSIGEGYVMLTQPFTIPSLMLRTELQDFTAEETGDSPDRRVVASVGDSRVGKLSPEQVDLFHLKWIAQWTRLQPRVSNPQ